VTARDMQIFSPQFNYARPLRSRAGFSILEVLVASAVLALLLVAMMSMTDQVQKTYRSTLGKAEQFREARVAFESITRRLSQATLNTYWDYDSPTTPTKYLRQSELRFLSGNASGLLSGVTPAISSTTHAVFFQAPFGFTSNSTYGGMESMVNTWGYFIEFGSDSALRPDPVNTAGVPVKYRFRLYEMMEPSETLSLYKYTGNSTASKTYTGRTWFTDALDKPNRSSRVLAENIVALIFRPLDPASTPPDLTTNYTYDTAGSVANIRNQLPPYIEVTMVAIDEVSARRLETGATPPVLGLTGLFQTASSYDANLATLRTNLNDRKINYRIFTANVSIQGAKWSRN
jgi:uncharacterized protein (TIGR02599 family)